MTAVHTVILHKRSGGSTLTGPDGEQYTWEKAKQGVQVPYLWAMELVKVPGGEFYIDGDPQPSAEFLGDRGSVQSADAAGLAGSEEDPHRKDETGEDEAREVTEPAPEGKNKVTEPAPPPEQSASPITPKPKGATQARK